jgi:perosamine synthetase
VADAFIPYGRQTIADEDEAAVLEVLRSAWLTTGPNVGVFEAEFAKFCGAREAVAVNSGTAALHAAMHVLDLQPGDEVIVPAITFAATANAVVYEGGTPVFADVQEDTLLIDPPSIEERLSPRTRAIAAVDYAGQPADYDVIRAIAEPRNIAIIADACHAPGAEYKGRPVGTLADISTFSFHPVKHITTGEGGIATTEDTEKAARMRRFRNHGIDSDHRLRAERGTFAYDMVELGYNYRLCDIQCALGIAQLQRLPAWIARRQDIASRYDEAFRKEARIEPLRRLPDRTHTYHLYVVRLKAQEPGARDKAFEKLRKLGIGTNVHYSPVYWHGFYRDRFGYRHGLCPVAERVYETILTLPVYPTMTDRDVDRVVDALALLENR